MARIGKVLLGREPFHRLDIKLPTEHHGTPYGGWSIVRDSLTANSIVYSFGIGQDASFDLSIIERYGCRVHAYDPTPASLAWVQRNIDDPRFQIEPLALGDHDGRLKFYLPPKDQADQVSASCIATNTDGGFFEAEVRTFTSILEANHHPHCDILKMDIEGMEYKVLANLQESGGLAKVSQLLIEFHHFLDGIGTKATHQAVNLLRDVGFRIAWISRTNHEYLFVRRDLSLQ